MTYFHEIPCLNLGRLPMYTTPNEVKAVKAKYQLYNVGLDNNKCKNFIVPLFLSPLLRAQPSQRRRKRFPESQLARWPLPSNGCCLVCFTIVV
jgi:hypothetical protein